MAHIINSELVVYGPPTTPDSVPRLSDLQDALESKWKAPVRAAAGTNLGGTYVPASKTLTASAAAALVVDGVNLLAGDRVLLYGQSAGAQNGIYVVTAAGDVSNAWIITRAADFDESSDVIPGIHVAVAEGTAHHDSQFVLATDAPIALDATPLVWTVATGNLPNVLSQEHNIAGDASTTSFTLTHDWNTRAVSVELIRKSDWRTTFADVTRPTVNTVQIDFAVAPAVGDDYLVLIHGKV
jgi:hypothetical protein